LMLITAVLGEIGRSAWMITENHAFHTRVIPQEVLILLWNLSTISWILAYVLAVLAWIQLKSHNNRNSRLSMKKLRIAVIVLVIISLCGLIPTTFLRLIASISTIMILAFDGFLAVFLLIIMTLYCVFGYKVWRFAIEYQKSFSSQGGSPAISKLISITRLLYWGNAGVGLMVATVFIWDLVDLTDSNAWLSILFQSILRVLEIFCVCMFMGAVHPIRKTSVINYIKVVLYTSSVSLGSDTSGTESQLQMSKSMDFDSIDNSSDNKDEEKGVDLPVFNADSDIKSETNVEVETKDTL